MHGVISLPDATSYYKLLYFNTLYLFTTALECSDISEGELGSTVNIHCILRNADEFIVDRLEVYHNDKKIFDERGNNGTVSSSDGDIILDYTNTDVTLFIFSLRCDQDGVYSFIINSVLLRNASIVVKRK